MVPYPESSFALNSSHAFVDIQELISGTAGVARILEKYRFYLRHINFICELLI